VSPVKGNASDKDLRSVLIPVGKHELKGDSGIVQGAPGLVLFAHGSGSSRLSPRNLFVARELRAAGLSTLLFDLLTGEEEVEDEMTGRLRFDIPFLAERLAAATEWAAKTKETKDLCLGYFGASTGAAAALVAAAELPRLIRAVVSRGGRPDLARESLPRVKAATLLIVGGRDDQVLALNKGALSRLAVEKELVIVPGATHLFEEPGALEAVARRAAKWLVKYLSPQGVPNSTVVS